MQNNKSDKENIFMKISHVLLSTLLYTSCFSEVTISGEPHQALYSEQSKKEYISQQTKKKLEDLCSACRLGDMNTVKMIVNAHVLNNTPKDGISIDINALDEEGCPPLIHACEEAQENIVACLLDIPTINLNIKKTDGTTPLIAACDCEDTQKKQKCTAIVRNILKVAKTRKVELDLDAKVTGLGWTALMFASAFNSTETVALLLEEGVTASLTDMEGLTAFDLAATDEIKQLLLSTKQVR